MAIFPPGNRPPGRRPALRGVLLQDLFRGVERTRSWPSKGPRRPTKAQLEARELFRQRVNATKYMPAIQQVQYREACEGTSFLPRDFLLMQMYGRLFAGVLPDGKVMYSMASRQTISESLDILCQTPNAILVRGEKYWQPLEIGDPGQVLAVNDDATGYQWVDISSDLGIHAAGSFHWSGSAIVMDGQSNVASVTRTAAGVYEVTMAAPASGTGYAVLCGGKWPYAADTLGVTVNLWRQFAITTTKFQLQAFYNNNQLFDPEHVYFIVVDLV